MEVRNWKMIKIKEIIEIIISLILPMIFSLTLMFLTVYVIAFTTNTILPMKFHFYCIILFLINFILFCLKWILERK